MRWPRAAPLLSRSCAASSGIGWEGFGGATSLGSLGWSAVGRGRSRRPPAAQARSDDVPQVLYTLDGVVAEVGARDDAFGKVLAMGFLQQPAWEWPYR